MPTTDADTSTSTDHAPTVYLPDGTPVRVRLVGAECEGEVSGEGHFGYRPADLNGEEPCVYFEEVRSDDAETLDLPQLVHCLIAQWRADIDDLPSTTGGAYSAASIDACAKELEYVLEHGELIDVDPTPDAER